MHRRIYLILFFIVMISQFFYTFNFLFAKFSSISTVRGSGKIIYPNQQFQMQGANVPINSFLPQAINYQPKAWDLLKEYNINVICVTGGVEGDIAHFNINKYPNEWAQNLENFLREADDHGFKVYFFNLGLGWGTLFGIVSPGDVGPKTPTPLDEAKRMIDKLAGNNLLNHNFITDSRIVGWRPSNEVDISDPYTLQWNLEICDYIKSKGGIVWLSSPRNGSWYRMGFDYTRPLIEDHVDFLEFHHYGIWAYVNQFDRNFTAWREWYKNKLLSHVVNARGNWNMDKIILGEFGMWVGEGSDQSTTATFTEDERKTYYTIVFNIAEEIGIKNVVFHIFFEQLKGPDWTDWCPTRWGLVDDERGYYSPSLDVIKEFYK